MKKFFLSAAILAASVWMTNLVAKESVNVDEAGKKAGVAATSTYYGTVTALIMDDKVLDPPIELPAEFDIDPITGDISGDFNILGFHFFTLTGNLLSGVGYGTINIPGEGTFDYEAVFTLVTLTPTGVKFLCTATITTPGAHENHVSQFTFVGTP